MVLYVTSALDTSLTFRCSLGSFLDCLHYDVCVKGRILSGVHHDLVVAHSNSLVICLLLERRILNLNIEALLHLMPSRLTRVTANKFVDRQSTFDIVKHLHISHVRFRVLLNLHYWRSLMFWRI